MTAVHTARAAPLGSEDVRSLRLPWSSPFDEQSLIAHVRAHPDRSFWYPQTGEYLIGEPWRHRREITTIADVSAREHAPLLIEALRVAPTSSPQELIVMTDFVNARPPSLYASLGLRRIQEVICYEMRAVTADTPCTRLTFRRASIHEPTERDALLGVDHASFPWLWHNTADEFTAYQRGDGVELYVGYDRAARPIAYFGVTHFRGWGHLDRIGVVPSAQGAGHGLEALRYAVHLLARAGATRIGLSTQADNLRSQRLYQRFGFQRTYQNDYHIHGLWIDPARAASAVTDRDGEGDAE
jgi:ribosomal protein S18 acetylase RimI-like enzyme